MKSIFVTCVICSFAATVIKIIILGVCKERVSRVFGILVDTVLLISIVYSLYGIVLPSFPIAENTVYVDYEKAEAEMICKIVDEAETMLEERVCNFLESRLGIKPYACEVQIDDNDLELEKICVYYDALISKYDVKSALKEEYGIKAEVIVN